MKAIASGIGFLRWFAPPDSWEDMNLYDRCITRGLPGAMIPGFYNHNYLVLQTPEYVVLQVEMIHSSEWTAAIPMRRSEDTLFEYACHEGNYAMPNILAGARADEAKAAEEQSR